MLVKLPRLTRQDDEHGLRDVFGIMLAGHLAAGGGEDHVDMPVDQRLKGFGVPTSGISAEQLGIGYGWRAARHVCGHINIMYGRRPM